jgi:hypothetical protein
VSNYSDQQPLGLLLGLEKGAHLHHKFVIRHMNDYLFPDDDVMRRRHRDFESEGSIDRGKGVMMKRQRTRLSE